MGAFATIVEVMAEMDVFQLFFPWLLVLSITYGVLEKSEAVSDDSSVNGAIALSMAFFAIGGAYLFLPEMILVRSAAALTFAIFALIGFMVLLGVSGVDIEEMGEEGGISGNPVAGIAVLIFIVGFIAILLSQDFIFDLVVSGSNTNLVEEVLMPILVLIFLALVVKWTLSDGEE